MLTRLQKRYIIISLFQLGELALGLKFPSQSGTYFRSDDLVSEGDWLTFLRLKALSSSFSTAWIFLTLMMQRASFPGKQKSFCHIYVSRILHSDSQKYQQPTVHFRFSCLCQSMCFL